jgi:hypothetical protein
MLCKGKTKGGERCGRNAGDSGYCSAHNPEKLAAKALRDEANLKQFERMNDVLATIHRTGKAKGWVVQLASQDTATWRYATVTVETGGFSMSGPVVTGRMNLTVGDEIKISLDNTSFHGHGLKDLLESIWSELYALPWVEAPKKKVSPPGIDRVLKVAGKFHTVATQITRRYDGRETLRISDEYDVQDLLHALLKIDFDDVRPEEYSPSKAGGASRLDFLLKAQRVVIEAKMARKTLTDKKLGEELIIDIARYRAHPDCETLVCLIYDPEHNIRNPAGLERDLSRKDGPLTVHVVVVPK